ncbi:unnamed protein product [Rotaria sordida]|uniref:Uncharacterized protein n=1 Tax=Rotaria sordida TaxID=392033 RepID=A0A814HU79_9BILA|nr:unnamed protein product [Rotaria sordida]CAF3930166.1 unnamed protein product [Rotaria sordida]
MNSIDNDEMKSTVLISTDQIQQQQEPIIIDLENESTSTSPFISSSILVNDNCIKKTNQIIHVASSEPSSSKQINNHRTMGYLSRWEKEPETYYRTMILNSSGELQESRQCWLRKKQDENGKITIGCFLCNKYQMIKNANGKINPWATYDYSVLALNKIKEHGLYNEKHIEAQELELNSKSKIQPDWKTTQSMIYTKHQQSIQNLMFTAIFICQQYHPLNSFEPLCNLQEKNGVNLLPAEVSGINYRNDCAALCFLQYTARILHQELVEKLNQSPILGWLIDESTSRTCEKSCIVYARYVDNYEQKTDFYGLINMNGDGTAQHIVDKLGELWDEDGINMKKTCWLATDNASTFTGIHNGVAAKLKKKYGIDYLELNTCAAHSFALVGSHAGKELVGDGTNRVRTREDVAQFESNLGQIYNFFHSACRLSMLKHWQNFLDLPELKFKYLFDIRWSSIRGCLIPIISNIEPGHQALFATLKQISEDQDFSLSDREKALDLYNSILDDSFLFYLHFHHDLQECVSGELTKMMQDDNVSYTILKDKIQEKKSVLNGWLSAPSALIFDQHTTNNLNSTTSCSYAWGPSLSNYIQLTLNKTYGAFSIDTKNRQIAEQNCRSYIERFLIELDRRFPISKVQESLSRLFDPVYLCKNEELVRQTGYGREQLVFLSKIYNLLDDFDPKKVSTEWESLRPSLIAYIAIDGKKSKVYLVSPTNSAACERGFSASNRIQTNSRARLLIETLNVLLTVRLLLHNDIRSKRCQQIVEKSFDLWNNPDENRRWKRTKLIIDIPDDYEPTRQTRASNIKRKRAQSLKQHDPSSSRPKKPKATAVKCANGCRRTISNDDPFQYDAIQCCHQLEYYSWINDNEECSRWLCNYCRIKLAIPTDSTTWFCNDHADMHIEDDTFEQEQSSELI